MDDIIAVLQKYKHYENTYFYMFLSNMTKFKYNKTYRQYINGKLCKLNVCEERFKFVINNIEFDIFEHIKCSYFEKYFRDIKTVRNEITIHNKDIDGILLANKYIYWDVVAALDYKYISNNISNINPNNIHEFVNLLYISVKYPNTLILPSVLMLRIHGYNEEHHDLNNYYPNLQIIYTNDPNLRVSHDKAVRFYNYSEAKAALRSIIFGAKVKSARN